MTPEDAAVLARLRAAIAAAYGERLRGMMLFGSRARGDHRPDSDYDVAVFLEPFGRHWDESDRLNDIAFNALEPPAAFLVSLLPFRDGALADRTPLMHEIRREGVSF